MKRKDYKLPTMKVVKLQYGSHILAGSGEQPHGAQRNDYEAEEWQ